MDIELWQLKNIIEATAKKAVAQVMLHLDPASDEMSARQAHEEFGKKFVDELEEAGLIKPRRKSVYKNSKKIYSRQELTEHKYGCDPLLTAIYNASNQ